MYKLESISLSTLRYCSTLKVLEEVEKVINEIHPDVEVRVTATDLKSGDNVRSLIAENKEQLDILVNNAGAIPAGMESSFTSYIWCYFYRSVMSTILV